MVAGLMKQPIIQRYRVTTENGSVVRVCCAPAITALPVKVVAYEPVGKPVTGVCCHKTDAGPARVWMLGERRMQAVREWLARRAGHLF